MKAKVESIILGDNEAKLVVSLNRITDEISNFREYDITRNVQTEIVKKIADDWYAKNGIAVMEQISKDAVLGQILLRLGKLATGERC